MLNNNQIGVVNISLKQAFEEADLTEEQLNQFEESHKKWVESGCWIALSKGVRAYS